MSRMSVDELKKKLGRMVIRMETIVDQLPYEELERVLKESDGSNVTFELKSFDSVIGLNIYAHKDTEGPAVPGHLLHRIDTVF